MANEGYIPYGLDRASRSMDEILEARKRMRNAEIMKSLVRGEQYQKALETGIEGAASLYGKASDRYADAAALDAQKKANIVESKSQVATLNATINRLDQIAKQNPNMAPEIEMKKAELEAKRARYQSILDSYDQAEMARIMGQQSQAETAIAKEKASKAEAGAMDRLMSIFNADAKTKVDEVLGKVKKGASLGQRSAQAEPTLEEAFGMEAPGPLNMLLGRDVQSRLDRLKGPQMEEGLTTRTIDVPQNFITSVGSIRQPQPAYPFGRKRTRLIESAFSFED